MNTDTKCARSVKSIGLLGPDFDRNVAILFPSLYGIPLLARKSTNTSFDI